MTSPHGMQPRLTAAAAQLWRSQNIGLTLKTYKSKNFRPISKIFAPFDALMNSLKCSRVSFSGGERFSGHLGKTGGGGGTLGPPSTARVNRGKAFFWECPGTPNMIKIHIPEFVKAQETPSANMKNYPCILPIRIYSGERWRSSHCTIVPLYSSPIHQVDLNPQNYSRCRRNRFAKHDIYINIPVRTKFSMTQFGGLPCLGYL